MSDITVTLTSGQGSPGVGVPTGGTTGQVLKKKTNTNYDTEWGTGGGGASTFVSLTDAPAAYTGHGGKIVAVKSDVSGLEFIANTGGATIEDTAVDGHSTVGISSNWAFDHAALTTAHGNSGTNTGDETASRIGTLVSGSSNKVTPVDADRVGFSNSESTNTLFYSTWAQIKAFLKTYYDTIYTLANLGGVATTRTITATTPITIEGTTSADLSANRTIAIPAATASVNGYATSTQITKLDGIAASANNYVHPNHSGEVTSSADGAQTIATAAVTLAKMANLAQNTIIGRVASGAGEPEALTAANVRTIISSPVASGFATISVGTATPGTPAENDLWIDLN